MGSLIELWLPTWFGDKHITMDETEEELVPGSMLYQNTYLVFHSLSRVCDYAVIVWGS